MGSVTRRRFLSHARLIPALAVAGSQPAALAQSAPPGLTKIIVPYPPGAATDALARLLAHELEKAAGGKFIVENRGGGGTQIGTKAVAAATPDGTTLGFVDTAFVINPALLGSALPYDTRRDFAPISLMASAPFVLLVHSSVPAKSVKELVDLARSKSGGLNYGSAGVGSAPHLAGEQLRRAVNADLVHVPYRGGSTVLNDLIAGHVQFGFTTVPTMIEHIREGTVRALAVTGDVRAAQLPDVPTMSELGYASVDARPLFGLIAPAGVPRLLIDKLGHAASTLVKPGGALNKRLGDMGFVPIGSTPAEFAARIDAEIGKWSEVVRAGNIKPGS
jgi:tripartite-type tricarboxylate transporter receptor subunit TctC